MDNATLSEKLSEKGWNITAAGLESLSENGKINDTQAIVKKLLDTDLRTVSKGSLPDDFSKVKYESLPGGVVLQVQKVKNLSSPKYQDSFNNPNPSIMKFVLTDGVQNAQGVAVEPIPSLNLNTLPGSKILLTGDVEITHGFLLLSPENTSFIGGRVEQLIEKWELNRKLAKHRRDNQEEGGPPPWIPFGQRIAKQIVADKNFKSLEQGKTEKVSENTEFEAQRKGAILEASKIGAPKVFGGGNNKLLDHNVQVIVDAGFTIEQAEYALKISRNNPDRALRCLQSRSSKSGKEDGKGKTEEKERGGKGKGRRGHREEDASSLKPSGKVSLFDFLEDKLPASEKEFAMPTSDFRNNFEKKFPKPSPSSKPSKPDERKSQDYDNKFGKRPEKKIETIRFDKKPSYEPRNDKSFGNFKVKNDFFPNKTDTARIGSHRWNEKRDTKLVNHQKPFVKPEKLYDDDVGRKTNFVPTTEKPPRFQKMANQPNDIVPMWNENVPPPPAPVHNSYPRLPHQTDFQLQNSLANLTLQQNIANFNHTQDHMLPPNLNKNMFFQNMASASTSGPSEVHRPPPASVPQPQSVPYQRRSPAASQYLPADMKSAPTAAAAYPGMPTVPDFPFKPNGTMMQGFNDFQTVFENAPRASGNAYNAYSNSQPNFSNPAGNFSNPQNSYPATQQPQPSGFIPSPNNFNNYAGPFLPAQQLMPQQQQQSTAAQTAQPRRWSWKKGHKCFARYWEDQNYYEAMVTGVSENTCVVHFTEYGNYEEVLHDDCVPIDGISPLRDREKRIISDNEDGSNAEENKC